MDMKNRLATVALVSVFALAAALPLRAAPLLKTESWADTDADFAAFSARIRSSHDRNLLAREGVAAVMDPQSGVPDAGMLIDGDAGTRGDRGRVFIDGQPSVITFFLGSPKTIKEVGAYSFNGDTRSNQDYEVRFANNSSAPGVVPDFPEKAQLTTGDRILGKDHGGFHTRFVDEKGGPLVEGKFDWVQFRIWRTYGVTAGHAARTHDPSSATAMVELEVLGDERDVVPPTPEQLAYMKAAKAALGQPEWVQRPTWRESLIATRESLLQWECLQDRLALHKAGVVLGPWHLLGPVPQGGKVAQQIQTAEPARPDGPIRRRAGQTVRLAEVRDARRCAGQRPGRLRQRGSDLPLPQPVDPTRRAAPRSLPGPVGRRRLGLVAARASRAGHRELASRSARRFEHDARRGRAAVRRATGGRRRRPAAILLHAEAESLQSGRRLDRPALAVAQAVLRASTSEVSPIRSIGCRSSGNWRGASGSTSATCWPTGPPAAWTSI